MRGRAVRRVVARPRIAGATDAPWRDCGIPCALARPLIRPRYARPPPGLRPGAGSSPARGEGTARLASRGAVGGVRRRCAGGALEIVDGLGEVAGLGRGAHLLGVGVLRLEDGAGAGGDDVDEHFSDQRQRRDHLGFLSGEPAGDAGKPMMPARACASMTSLSDSPGGRRSQPSGDEFSHAFALNAADSASAKAFVLRDGRRPAGNTI